MKVLVGTRLASPAIEGLIPSLVLLARGGGSAKTVSEIFCFHGRENVGCCLLDCDAVYS
jgi:hypothetical protein